MERSSTTFSITNTNSNTGFVAFGRFKWPFLRRALAQFYLQDLSTLDEFSVLRYGYFVVILFEVSVDGS